MKIWVKMMLAAAIMMLITTGIMGCTQEKTPNTTDKQENIQEQEDITDEENVHGNETTQDQDQNKNENDERQSADVDGKLVPDPSVELREGMDYLAIDVSAEDFELNDLEGNTVKLSDYEGDIVFLNFWATWCPPCREEMPDMEEIHKEYGDKGVAILAVNSTTMELRGGTNSEKAKQQVEEFINDNGYTFPILLDTKDKVLMTYNSIYPVTGIPTTFMIDKKGQIRYARPGAFTGKEQMEAFIALLDE